MTTYDPEQVPWTIRVFHGDTKSTNSTGTAVQIVHDVLLQSLPLCTETGDVLIQRATTQEAALQTPLTLQSRIGDF